MRTRIAACSVVSMLVAAAAAAQPARVVTTRHLSLDAATRMAIENNRHLQTARLQVEKADADVAVARTRRLPAFETEATGSYLLSPVQFGFPQGAFGDFPATGPIPATATTVTVPRQPTLYLSSQVSQPISQLVRSGLGPATQVVRQAALLDVASLPFIPGLIRR